MSNQLSYQLSYQCVRCLRVLTENSFHCPRCQKLENDLFTEHVETIKSVASYLLCRIEDGISHEDLVKIIEEMANR